MNKLLTIINHYGIEHQQEKLNEEHLELQKAITMYECGKDTKEHIAEEIADCENMLGQFREYYEIPKPTITRVCIFKQDRQLKRIKEKL